MRGQNYRIALAIVGGLGILTTSCSLAPSKSTLPITEKVSFGDVEQAVLATGALEPYTLVSVGAQTSGRVETLGVRVGQKVKKGDLIAEIDSRVQRNELTAAELEVANVKAQRIQLESNLLTARLKAERQRSLKLADAVSNADLEMAEEAEYLNAQSAIKVNDAQLSKSEVALENARVNLGYTRITAPIDGTVLAIVTKAGQTINSNQTAPTIVKLGQLDRMTVKAQIAEADVVKLKPGMPVYITTLGGDLKQYKASLETIYPAPDLIKTSDEAAPNAAVYYTAEFQVNNPDGALKTFMTVQLRIVSAAAHHVLRIPSAAIGSATNDGKSTVKVIASDGTLKEQKVQTGLDDGTHVEILAGLKPGERVVILEDAQDAAPQHP